MLCQTEAFMQPGMSRIPASIMTVNLRAGSGGIAGQLTYSACKLVDHLRLEWGRFTGAEVRANVPGIASALPQSARDARLPLAPSFAGYGEAPSECSTGADVRGAENLTTERGDSGDAQQLGAKVGHQAQPAAKC